MEEHRIFPGGLPTRVGPAWAPGAPEGHLETRQVPLLLSFHLLLISFVFQLLSPDWKESLKDKPGERCRLPALRLPASGFQKRFQPSWEKVILAVSTL